MDVFFAKISLFRLHSKIPGFGTSSKFIFDYADAIDS